MKQGLRKFERQVSDMLPCSKEVKEGQLEQIRKTLEDRADNISYEEVVEELGAPEEVAAAVIQELDGRDVARSMRTRNRIVRAVALFLGMLLLIVSILLTVAVIDGHSSVGGKQYISGPHIIPVGGMLP